MFCMSIKHTLKLIMFCFVFIKFCVFTSINKHHQFAPFRFPSEKLIDTKINWRHQFSAFCFASLFSFQNNRINGAYGVKQYGINTKTRQMLEARRLKPFPILLGGKPGGKIFGRKIEFTVIHSTLIEILSLFFLLKLKIP
jgi:hypothetical protein